MIPDIKEWKRPRWQLFSYLKGEVVGESNALYALCGAGGVYLSATRHRWRVDARPAFKRWSEEISSLARTFKDKAALGGSLLRQLPLEQVNWERRPRDSLYAFKSVFSVLREWFLSQAYDFWKKNQTTLTPFFFAQREIVDPLERSIRQAFWALAIREGHLKASDCPLFNAQQRRDLEVWADACMAGVEHPEPEAARPPLFDVKRMPWLEKAVAA